MPVCILLVDDDDDLRTSLDAFLRVRKHTVRSVRSGEEALVELGRFQPELLISDIQMPGMDGLELLRRVRELNADLPVILMTTEKTVDTAVKALQYGALDYLEKPVDLKALYRRVERIQDSGSG